MRNYNCNKCGSVVQKQNTPTAAACHGGGNHTWRDLGAIGTKIYNCNKCNTTVHSANTPTATTCPHDGNHTWHEL